MQKDYTKIDEEFDEEFPETKNFELDMVVVDLEFLLKNISEDYQKRTTTVAN